ncbi:hypothetical protein PLICRDRAFT_699931 [Plicaturopsis crispa FD-325 SS-3]|nr:hypothetical protein PLICRDRAFT_699931 [Plicaturopsis crispa FD-325 SS-3]
MPPIQCDSVSALKHALDPLRVTIALPETEDSWEKIAKAIATLTALCNDSGACDFPSELIPSMRALSRPVTNAMISERTRLSGSAIDLVSALASGLGSSFEPLLQLYMPTILGLCTRSNKVFLKRANACLLAVIEGTQLPSIIPYLLESVKDKSATLRLAATEGVLVCLNCYNPPDLEKEARAREVESIIRTTARDANVDVRKASRKVFEAYKILLPGRVNDFISPLTPITKKYLDIKGPTAPSNTTTRPGISHTRSTPAELNLRPLLTAAASTVHIPSHTRSASSSALNTVKTTHPEPAKSTRRDMPPPDIIPVRPAPAPASRPPSRPVSQASSRSGDGPIRPRSAADAVLPHVQAAQPPRLNQSAGAPPLRRPPVRPPQQQDSAAARSGPIRPPGGFRQAAKPEAGAAPQRVTGGARRVPRPPTPEEPVAAAPAKRARPAQPEPAQRSTTAMEEPTAKRARTISRPARPTVAASNPEVSHKSTHSTTTGRTLTASTSSRPGVTKANEKAKPVAKPAAAASSSSSARAEPAKPRAGGATQPTLAQLARTKPLVTKKAEPAAPKASWGRPAVTKKASAPALKGKASAPALKGKSTAADKKPAVVVPASVPLPPSPVPEALEDEKEETPVPAAVVDVGEPADEEHIEEAQVDTPASASPTPDASESESSSRSESVEEPTVSLQTPPDSPSRPKNVQLPLDAMRTPVSALISSIEQGFLFSPASPLSPPQSYLNVPFPMRKNGEMVKGSIAPGLRAMKPLDTSADNSRSALSDVEGNR